MHQPTPFKLLWLLRINAPLRSFLILSILQIAPSDLYLFPNLKTNLHGRNFGSNEGVTDAVDEYLGNQEESFYFEGINKLEQH